MPTVHQQPSVPTQVPPPPTPIAVARKAENCHTCGEGVAVTTEHECVVCDAKNG